MEKEEGEEVVVEEEEEEPRCRRVLLVDEESLVNEEDPTLLPLDREELIGSGGSLDYALFPEGVIIVRQSGDEGEQRNIVDDEEEYEEEEEEKEKYPFYVEETTFNLDDCGLCQLLGQIHDTIGNKFCHFSVWKRLRVLVLLRVVLAVRGLNTSSSSSSKRDFFLLLSTLPVVEDVVAAIGAPKSASDD
eukprot:gene8078-8907_t